MWKPLFLILFILSTLSSNALNLKKENFRYQYDPEFPFRVYCTFQVHPASPDSTIAIVQLHYTDSIKWLPRYKIACFTQKNFKSSKETFYRSVALNEAQVLDSTYFNLQISIPSHQNLFLLEIMDEQNGNSYYFDFRIPLVFPFVYFDNQVRNAYATLGDTIHLSDSLSLYMAVDTFSPGSFYEKLIDHKPATMLIASSGKVRLERPGSYFLKKEKDSLFSKAFYVGDSAFPHHYKIHDLIGPITYLTTSKEFETIITSSELKYAYDDFWISQTKSEERAKHTIRKYYNRVEYTNIIFTDYKEGWKTAKGMLLIMYGLPDAVSKKKCNETWIYYRIRGFNNNVFKLQVYKNAFGSYSYYLVNGEDYLKLYNSQAGLWRKGRI